MSSPVSDASRERKRRKTQRACDHCRGKKLRCEYPADLNDPVCNNCRDDKRRLQILMERAVTEDDKTKLAMEVAQRGVYTAKDESETLLKPLEMAVGGLLTRGPPAESSSNGSRPSTGPSTGVFPSSIDSASARRPRSSNGVHAGPSNGMGVKREPVDGSRLDPRSNGSRRPYAPAPISAPPVADYRAMRDRQWANPAVPPYHQGPPPNMPMPNANAEASSSSSMSLASAAISAMPVRRASSYSSNRTEPRMLGPTAITNLLTEMKGKTDISNHDERFGLIRVDEGHTYYGDPPDPFSDVALARQAMSDGVKTNLASFYADNIAVLNPVILPAQARKWRQLDPALQYAVFGVAALNRQTPLTFVIEIRKKLDALLMEGVERTSSLANVQAMLITAMSHVSCRCHMTGRTVLDARARRNCTGGHARTQDLSSGFEPGRAVRQAQDIGLDVTTASSWTNDILADRSRVWLSCLVTDRWYGITYGHPAMVNLSDIEDPLRHEYIHQEDTGVHVYQQQLYKVSCLAGRVVRAIYRPGALANTSDDDLKDLLASIDGFLANLPPQLAFRGQQSSSQAVVLSLLLVITEVLLFRSFLKTNSQSIPDHIGWRPTCERWRECAQRARLLISWMNEFGDVILDSWCIGKAAMGYAALAQYYQYSDDREAACLNALQMAEDLMHRWACGHNAEVPTAFRAKVAEIVRLVHRAAQAMSHRPQPGHASERHPEASSSSGVADSGTAYYPEYPVMLAAGVPQETTHYMAPAGPGTLQDFGRPPPQLDMVYTDHMVQQPSGVLDPTMPFNFWPGDGATTSDDFLYKFYNNQIPGNLRLADEQTNSKILDGDQVTFPSHLVTSRTDWGGAFQ